MHCKNIYSQHATKWEKAIKCYGQDTYIVRNIKASALKPNEAEEESWASFNVIVLYNY